MNFEEFLKPDTEEVENNEPEAAEEETIETEENIDVQKAVVESLAAEKVMQEEKIGSLETTAEVLRKENDQLKSEKAMLEAKIAEMRAALEKVGDTLAINAADNLSNKVALLDREVELDERFPGETREHVIEILKEARDKAEADGRLRRAKLIESVLVANESTGALDKKRKALEKLFNDNQNILNGLVIDILTKYNITYKNGENYLLPAEIMKRMY